MTSIENICLGILNFVLTGLFLVILTILKGIALTTRRKKKSVLDNFKKLVESKPALKPVFASIALILSVFLLTVFFRSLDWPSKWTYYSITLGILVGLVVGYSLLSKISDNWKFGTVGAFSGLGLDLASASTASAALNSNPGTHTVNLVNSISAMIGNIAIGLLNKEELKANAQVAIDHIAIGIWTMILVIGVVFLMDKVIGRKVEGT